MESQAQELRDKIKQTALKGERLYSVLCKVTEVDKANLTCDVKTADELYIFSDIKLNAVYAFESGLNVIPKNGSFVVVTFIDKNIGYVSMFSEVEEIDMKIDDLELNASKDGLEIKKGSLEVTIKEKIKIQNLKKDLDDLVTAIKAITVPTGVGPSGTPVNAVQFDAFKTNYSQYLE